MPIPVHAIGIALRIVRLLAAVCSTAADTGIVPWHLRSQGTRSETEAEGWLERGKK
jgi:hypothetical protein